MYDPETRVGKVALSASRGVLRFVGGGISKKSPVVIRTPMATMGIRGGIAIVEIGAQTTATFLFGDELTVTGNGMTQRTDRPGHQIVVDQQGMPQEPRPVVTDNLSVTLTALETQQPSLVPGMPEMHDDDVADTMVSLFNSDAGLGEFSTEAGGDGGDAPAAPQPNEGAEASQNAMAAATLPPPPAENPPADEPQVEAQPVENPPAAAPPAADGAPTQPPPLAQVPAADPPAQEPEAPTTPPRAFVGAATYAMTGAAPVRFGLVDGAESQGGFQAQTTDGASFALASTDGSGQTTSAAQPFGSGALAGATFAIAPGYRVFELVDQSNGALVFGFAGQPTLAAELPTGVTTFPLRADFLTGATLPFIEDVGPDGLASSGRVHVAWDASAPGAQPAFGGGAVAIFGTGEAQKSVAVSFFGRVLFDAEGRPHLQGRTIGRRNELTGGSPQRYIGGISSADGGDGSDLFGPGGNFVLQSTGVDDSDVAQSSGVVRNEVNKAADGVLQRQHATGAGQARQGARSTRTIQGFAAGLERRIRNGSLLGFDTVTTGGAPGASLSTRADLNTVSGSFALKNGSGQDVSIAFGDVAPTGQSAFIDDGAFFAGSGQIVSNGAAVAGDYGLVTASELQHDGLLPAGVSFCACDYVTWGFLFGDRQSTPSSNERRDTPLATFVAGQLSDASQLVGIAPQTATYSGHLIGGVARNKVLHQAVGSLSMSVRFGAGGFAVESAQIGNFDGANLTGGSAQAFGANAYSVDLTGAHPAAGAISARLDGAFYGPGAPPANTAGQFTMSGTNFRAAGTYAAAAP